MHSTKDNLIFATWALIELCPFLLCNAQRCVLPVSFPVDLLLWQWWIQRKGNLQNAPLCNWTKYYLMEHLCLIYVFSQALAFSQSFEEPHEYLTTFGRRLKKTIETMQMLMLECKERAFSNYSCISLNLNYFFEFEI